jgi:hypothetical protein
MHPHRDQSMKLLAVKTLAAIAEVNQITPVQVAILLAAWGRYMDLVENSVAA